jgi:predicted MFS family arabinose efflux permease
MTTARITLPGVALVAATFGLARYGYGLLVPEMRSSFGLDGTALGLLASSAYAAYLIATVATITVVDRLGPRSCAVLAGALATAGMALVARASSLPMLTLGIVVAGASSGLALPPFADLVARHVEADRRGGALAAISSGTGWGVALAAPVALALGSDWRATWLVFAGAAATVCVLVRVLVPSGKPARRQRAASGLSVAWFLCSRSRPLLLSAFLVGLSASVYWTFAPEIVQSAQSATHARWLFIIVGISSIGGSFADGVLRRTGTVGGFRICGALIAASLLLVAVAAHETPLVITSGLMFGVAFNLIVAIQVIWSGQVFASRPSAGLAATMLMFGGGQILGPTLAGAIADGAGTTVAFALAASIMGFTLVLAPPERVRRGQPLPSR